MKKDRFNSWLSRFIIMHEGRSFIRLSILLVVLLLLLPISLALEFLRDFFTTAADWVNELSHPVQKWAYTRKVDRHNQS